MIGNFHTESFNGNEVFIIGVINVKLAEHVIVTVGRYWSLLGVNFSLLVSLQHSPRKEAVSWYQMASCALLTMRNYAH